MEWYFFSQMSWFVVFSFARDRRLSGEVVKNQKSALQLFTSCSPRPSLSVTIRKPHFVAQNVQLLLSAFCDFFRVFLTLHYDYMCFETYFTYETTTRVPNPPPHFTFYFNSKMWNIFARVLTSCWNLFVFSTLSSTIEIRSKMEGWVLEFYPFQNFCTLLIC